MKIKMLKSTLLSALLLCGIHAGIMAQETPFAKLKLSDCLNYALKNSYEIHKSTYDVAESAAGYKEAKGALLPQLNGNTSLTDNLKLASTMMPGEIIGDPGTLFPVEMGTQYTTYVGVDLNQVIFDTGLFTGIKISKNAKEVAVLKKSMTQEDLIFSIGNAFYDIIYSQQLLANNRETLAITDSIYRKMEMQVAQNITREIDLNRMKVNISNIQVEIEKTFATIVQQKNYLKILMGMPIESELELEENIDLTIPQPVLVGNDESELSNKIELQILDKEKNVNLLEIRQLKQSYLPSLSFVASSGYHFESEKLNWSNSNFWSNGTYIGVSLSVPIFDGLIKHNKINQSKFRLSRIEEDIKQARQTILSNRKNAALQLLVNYRSVNAQRENVEVAEKTYQQGISLYQEGLYSITDLLDTEKSYRIAQTAYTYELVNYRKTVLDLMKSEGTLNELVNQNK
jgi:outer membrane protein TolC